MKPRHSTTTVPSRARSVGTEENFGSNEDLVTQYKTAKVKGLDIFYREAGPKDAPTLLLLHGFPTSSHMFRNLIPALADTYHIVAPDYPGYGYSAMPSVTEFDYTFDHLAEVVDELIQQLEIERYSL